MERHIRLGVLVPSSNTALEPLTQAIIASIRQNSVQISVHFSRFAVTKIDLSEHGRDQFEFEPILAAARLLAHAKVDVIGWSGTSGGWLGFDHDKQLCSLITSELGIPATTSSLALLEALKTFKVKELGLITPYLPELNQAIISNLTEQGFDVRENWNRFMSITENTRIVAIDENILDAMIEDVANNGAKTITTFCTNLRAAQRVEYWEKRHGILVIDTVAVVLWQMLYMTGIDMSNNMMCKDDLIGHGWGRIFTKRQ